MKISDIRYTVVITAHNEEQYIGNTILALSNQTGLEAGALEILLVDDASTDSTVEEALASGSDILSILHNETASKPELTTRQRALDLGFRHARGDIILTLDADGRPGMDWVSKMVEPIAKGHADAVAGPVAFVARSGWISAWQSCDVAYYMLVSMIVSRAGFAGGVLFGNFSFKSSLYHDCGGFDALGFALTEDLQFGKAIHAMGGNIAYTSRDSLVEFSPCRNFRALIERTIRVSSGRFSLLTAVLTFVPLSLLSTILLAFVLGGAAAWSLLTIRYLLGVVLVSWAQWSLGKRTNWPAAFLYEVAVYVVALGVLIRMSSKARIAWGHNHYDR